MDGMGLRVGSVTEVLGGRRWSPAEIGRQVNGRAARLAAAGLGPGDVAFVLFGNRLEFFDDGTDPAAVTAVERAGATALDALKPAAAERSPLGEGAHLDRDALILFTSGSSGQPKGVVHTHRSLRARWTSLKQSFGLRRFRRTLVLLPTHFGHGLCCNALFPWLWGCDLFVAPPFRPDLLAASAIL